MRAIPRSDALGFSFRSSRNTRGGIVISDFSGESDGPGMSLEFDWARPLNARLQLTNNASPSTVFTEDPVHNLMNTLQAYFELSNRIDWDNYRFR